MASRHLLTGFTKEQGTNYLGSFPQLIIVESRMLLSYNELSVLTIRKELELAGTNMAMDAIEDSATATTQLLWAYCTKAIIADMYGGD